MLFAVAILLAVVLGSLSAYVIHWVMHRSWSGPLYRSHMEHHQVHYPPSDLYSTGKYRSSGWSSGWLTFTPIVALSWLGILAFMRLLHLGALGQGIVLAVFAVLGWAHGYVHDAFHVSDHRLGRFAWFQRLRLLHEPHHFDMRKNLGILWFGWDRVFGTFTRPADPR